jgi:hypothetical protein
MKLHEEVQRHFTGFSFGAPCSEAEIQRAEAALGTGDPGIAVVSHSVGRPAELGRKAPETRPCSANS